ncbi:ADP-ribosylglycohydrolase family protein [Limosilactobacillus reuteri]|uniref:ADP-ribosylglycohydrolase family protein n=1 Tax=Limosilactobacillus reuteri TaxID=1598 RepID=UPI001E45D778|nr:ADP-ribosylglycohydrolase family protein [Limosilactobacillus reuteri]MCC4381593.1 ADP-ribosylglycohydrolase family protein [Limosilactobacillus reuteri]
MKNYVLSRLGGEHDQPIVTWPDDTSMVLCTIKSLIECTDQMSRFEERLWRGSNTAHNEVFGVGGLN